MHRRGLAQRCLGGAELRHLRRLGRKGPLPASQVLDEINLAPSDLLQRVQGLIERSSGTHPNASEGFRLQL